MKYYFIILSVLILLSGCKGQQFIGTSINFDNSVDYTHKLDYKLFTQSVDSVILEKGSIPLSRIRKTCINDSLLFILDDMKSIFVYNTENGHLIKQIQKIGHGEGEYIEPMSIALSDSFLYVLDLSNTLILKYDYNLNYKDCIKCKFHAFDFVKVQNGFLMWNMESKGDAKRIVHIGDTGKIIESFLSNDMILDYSSSTQMFSDDGYGKYYALESLSDTIYEWVDNELKPLYGLDYGMDPDKKYRISSEKAEDFAGHPIGGAFVSNKYVILMYLKDQYLFTNVFDRNTQQSHSGVMSNIGSFPFFPMALHKNVLYSVVDKITNKDALSNYNTVLLKYKLKK